MGILSRLFGKKGATDKKRSRTDQPDVFNVFDSDERMNWAMQKAKLTLHFFEESLKEPEPGQSYFSIKVKIVDGLKAEHIWLNNPNFDDEGNLFGVVGNKPIDVTNVSIGQKIGIDKDLISDWMIITNGRLIGGYTIRAVRDGLKGSVLTNFDKGLGGIIVDEGEDYFLPNSETPEGAILLIEEAYDEDNLEKAIACKDFNHEAEVMLSSKGMNLTSEVIAELAEVLKLAFIKSLQDSGMPKFKDVKRAFKRKQKSQNHYFITELCSYRDGSKSSQIINVWKGNDGWKVMGPENE